MFNLRSCRPCIQPTKRLSSLQSYSTCFSTYDPIACSNTYPSPSLFTDRRINLRYHCIVTEAHNHHLSNNSQAKKSNSRCNNIKHHILLEQAACFEHAASYGYLTITIAVIIDGRPKVCVVTRVS